MLDEITDHGPVTMYTTEYTSLLLADDVPDSSIFNKVISIDLTNAYVLFNAELEDRYELSSTATLLLLKIWVEILLVNNSIDIQHDDGLLNDILSEIGDELCGPSHQDILNGIAIDIDTITTINDIVIKLRLPELLTIYGNDSVAIIPLRWHTNPNALRLEIVLL